MPICLSFSQHFVACGAQQCEMLMGAHVDKPGASVSTGAGGGALALEFATLNTSELVYAAQFTDTSFVVNLGVAPQDDLYSGAVYVTRQVHNSSHVPVVTVDNCTVSENINGGMVLNNLGNLSITGCRFFGNGPLASELLLFLINEAAVLMDH